MDIDITAARRAIRVFLAERGKTQDWLAKRVRIHKSTLSRVFRGHEEPSDKLVSRVLRETGVDIRSFRKVA